MKIDFFLPLVVLCGRINYWKIWNRVLFFQHDDLKLSTKSCVGSVPCVTLLFLEVFGPEKKSGQVNRSYKYKRDCNC